LTKLSTRSIIENIVFTFAYGVRKKMGVYELVLFARHFSHILALSFPVGAAIAIFLYCVFSDANGYWKIGFFSIPFCLFVIIWITNPYLIERFNLSELDQLRKNIARLFLSNTIQGKKPLTGIETIGKGDDLVFSQALKTFKPLTK
jgi:hypothetical protein